MKWWNNFLRYLREVKVELKKVVLPDSKSLWGSTLVVIVVSIILGVVIGGFDLLISKIFGIFTR